MIHLDKCIGSCNTLDDLSNRVCFPNKTEDLYLNFFYIITGINESKILTKHVSCKCECKFYGRKYDSNQKWNNHKCRCECKNPKEHNSCEQDYILNPATSSGENGKYVGSITEDSVNTSVEIIPTTKISLTKTSFYTSLTFLLITIVLLIAVSAYCYLIKYKSKRTFIAILRRN